MFLVLTHIIALIVGAAIGFAGFAAVQGYLTLRRQLKEAQTALEARETAPQPTIKDLQEIVDRRAAEFREQGSAFAFGDAKPTPDFMGGIGPSAIAARELYDRQQAQEKATPKFANPGVLNPTLADIGEAAREATNGGKPS